MAVAGQLYFIIFLPLEELKNSLYYAAEAT
jgi:hypothetical protein